MSTKIGLPVKIFAGVTLGSLVVLIGLAVLLDDKPNPPAQTAAQTPSTPVVQQAQPTIDDQVAQQEESKYRLLAKNDAVGSKLCAQANVVKAAWQKTRNAAELHKWELLSGQHGACNVYSMNERLSERLTSFKNETFKAQYGAVLSGAGDISILEELEGPSKPMVQPVKSAASKWGCKANDAECASLAEKAEAEYQAKGGDAHEKAEEEAFEKPEALAANEYFGKFLTAKKSGATQAELCHLLQVAHLGYVEAGATDEASNTHDWQVQYRCGS